tara:strand:- start:277 stop:642 length:366 start_codon:yes stop_codon:yes gene_type:complete
MSPDKSAEIENVPEGMEERNPQRWTPEQSGDEISGIYFEKGHSSKYGNEVYYLENDDGQHFIFGNSVLETRMKAFSIGEFILIRYMGKEDSVNFPNPMNMFKVFGQRKNVKPETDTEQTTS